MRTKAFLLLFISTGFLFSSCLKKDVNTAEGTLSPLVAVEVVKNLYKGTDVQLTPDKTMGAYQITGVVISDPANKNIPDGNLVIQNIGKGNLRGITIPLGAGATYVPGDSVIINITGGKLVNVKGSMQITGITPDKVTKVASNVPIIVKQITLGELAAKFSAYEGTLVQINAGITPTPSPADTYAGNKNLSDGSGAVVELHTEATASFATKRVAASAAFTGIALYFNANANDTTGAKKQLWMRSAADIKNASGPLYAGYPEDFETPDFSQKGSYDIPATNNNINLKTGNWKLFQAILGNTTDRDRFNPTGKQCIRMQQNLSVSGYVQMNYDVPFGATKVTLSYGAYYTDATSTWRLEYSTDGGTTWQQTGSDIKDAPAGSKTATFLMDIQGPVRFRVNKLGLGTTNGTTILNGRLCIEDIAIYQN